ncbi:hypothetical protein [Candidatus Methylacidithermus pantelleriae]|uniref:DUF4405 domain-containing protein n=1 Tax=Candidatus Methylacidithermus pantelleriae TaxID=2744239 RepID=A0A8J2FNZ2_9BACT|nr:hypothetical protein [Candidatus Methylacidithermus pantelleriae]CAF0695897.1 conserved membrane hypothetical protein [Candidatus Methylacidithermus pantelleriae]
MRPQPLAPLRDRKKNRQPATPGQVARPFALPLGYKLILFLTLALLWMSGMLWVLFQDPRVFGAVGRPESVDAARSMLLALHGLGAFLFLALLGSLFPLHIAKAWRAKENLPSGVILLGSVLLLVLTGYALYYAGSETGRRLASRSHIWLGGVMPLLLAWHAWGYRRRKKPNPQAPES